MRRPMRVLCFLCVMLWVLMPTLSHAQEQNKEDYFTILLIGEDDAARMTLVDNDRGRADAVIAVSLSLQSGRIRMLSIDRDLLIDREETGVTKLCLTNYLGGPQCVLDSVNAVYDLGITTYAMVGTKGMGKLIDKLGGVEVEVTEEELGLRGFSKAGVQVIKGTRAVTYMRSREPDDDVHRNERQRKVLAALIAKLRESEVTQLLDFAQEAMAIVETNLTLEDITRLSMRVFSLDIGSPEEMRTPKESTRQFVNVHSVIIPTDWDAERSDAQAFLFGE